MIKELENGEYKRGVFKKEDDNFLQSNCMNMMSSKKQNIYMALKEKSIYIE